MSSSVLPPRPLKKDGARNYASQPPSWSSPPPPSASRLILEMYKEDPATILETVNVHKRPVHSFGRNADLCTHPLQHGSISRQHALIVHTPTGPYLVDLFSSQGTQLNEEKIEPGQPVALHDGDVITFGVSSRRYRVTGSGRRKGEDGADSTDASTITDSTTRDKRPRDDDSSSLPPSSRPRPSPSSTKIRASHLLLKHTRSRRPHSHHGPITRTPEQALTELASLRSQLLPHLTLTLAELLPHFAALAKEHSDCSSYKAGGDLGRFSADKMQKPFSEVAFQLKVGEVSDVVTTESGLHLILRTE